VTRVENHVLVVVLDGVEFLDYVVVSIIESDECDDLARRVLKPRVGLDIFEHRLPNGSGAILEVLVLPDAIELCDHLVWDVETRSHTFSLAASPQ
jgi:hypothetical protein